jgi:hypothetical protein
MTTSAFDPANDELIIAKPRKEIVFIEDNVADIDTLIKGIGSGKEIVILDSSQDGLHQMAQALAGRSGVDALHIVSHGQIGTVGLGSLMLDAGSLGAHQEDLQAIGASLSAGGDILLYGCDIGAGNGAGFMQQLAIATGADVAASNDRTGSAALGGDWNLEVSAGQVDAASIASPQLAALYENVLNLTNKTVGFSTGTSFIANPSSTFDGPSGDVVYKVGGDINYQLVIDAASTAVYVYTSNSDHYLNVANQGTWDQEKKVTFSFAGGQLFTLSSLQATNFQNPADASPSMEQTLTFTGFDSAGNVIRTQTGYVPKQVGNTTLALNGFTNVAKLTITTTENNGFLKFVALDNLVFDSIQAAPPKVGFVTSTTANGTYKIGDQIDIAVGFDSAVDVTGTPQLTLETGATDRVVNYLSGSGTSTLTFRYTVQAGDTSADLDYLGTGAIALNSGTIKLHSGSTDADLTLPTPGGLASLGANKAIVVDGVVPTMAITSDKTALKAGDTAAITFTFSENPGASFDGTDVAVSGGTLSTISGSGLTRTATFTPTAGTNSGAASISVAAGKFTDAAGNNNTAISNGPAISYDTLQPTVTITSNKATLKAGDTAAITFTFSEDPGATFTWNGSAGDVSVSGGTLSAISGSGLVRTATFTPAANTNNGTASISVGAGSFADAAGNVNSSAGATPSITYDTKAPTLAISTDKALLKAGDTATITFTFSEDPGSSFSWDGTSGDVSVSGGTLSPIAGSGTVRTATFTPDAGLNGSTASVSVNAGSYADAAGNINAIGSSVPTMTVDTVAPGAPSTPVLASGDDSGASNSDGITNKNPLSFSGTTEPVATVRLYDGATEVGQVTTNDGNWTIPVAGLAEGSHTLTAVATDNAGNVGTASAGLTITVDRTPPTTTVASATLGTDTGASATDMVTNAAAQTISGTLSANLAAGERVMVSLDNGATWNPAVASAGSNAWELAATLAGSGTLKIQVVDAAGNGGAVYANAYTLDTTAPAAPSTPDLDAASDSGASDTDDITGVTLPSFSGTAEAGATVTLFDGGIEIGSAVATNGTWHITTSSSTPMNERIHHITAGVTDLAGNHGPASPELLLDVRTAGPSTAVATLALSNDTGVAGDFVTSAASQTVSGTLSANLAAGERVQVSLNNGGTWTDATSTVGQSAWSLALTLAAGNHDIQVRVIDSLDNFSAALSQAYTLDAVQPTVAITSDVAQLKAGDTATITFTFSEDPGTSFDLGDIAVSGGTLSALGGTGLTRTAVFTPTAGVDGGTASIGIAVGAYHDLAGNDGLAGTMPTLTFDTHAPAAPSAPDLDHGSDSGALDTDNVTGAASQLFTGTAEAGTTVRLFDTDSTTEIGHATATGGTWSITAALPNGSHTVTAKSFDAAGNASAASSPLTVTVDRVQPAAMAAPALAAGSDSAALGDGLTKVAKPTFKGNAEAYAQVTLYDGASVLGTASANASGAWEFTPAANLPDRAYVISARQVDLAGNQSDASAVFNLTIDTVGPAAPGAPSLNAASDTDTVGDGITENNLPVIEGTALANTLVTLYDISAAGKATIGSAMADGAGKWSITAAGLSVGAHSLTATQSDAAGNESTHSAAFALRVDAPPVPVNLIDGVAVDIQPVSLPGGVIGSAVSIPIVGAGRLESSGHPGVADIPLATSSQGGSLLLAQVPAGVGLSASGANVPAASGAELLLAAIKAATPTHAATDQGHLTSNGQSFLAGLASSGTLLVETVKPVSAANAPDAVLTLSGPAQSPGHSTALVIDASGMGAGATIALQDVSFAAVIGAANVSAASGMILTGDAASQHFTVTAASGPNAVLAGGGNDTLILNQAVGATGTTGTSGAVTLHGGSANDVAVFSGARADYNLAFHNGYLTVSAKSGPAATATVINVETLQFSDGSVAVQNSADMGTLAGIYQTVLGRQADVYGIEYWANVHQAGASWGAIALAIVGSSEKTAGHDGFNGVAAHDLTLLYTALFNRAPDAAGLAYWTDVMAHGVSLEQVATGFVQSVEMVGHQRGALDWEFTL